jgi:hypothetical protein
MIFGLNNNQPYGGGGDGVVFVLMSKDSLNKFIVYCTCIVNVGSVSTLHYSSFKIV